MATNSLSIKYRPLKIGFLIRDGSIDDLVKAAETNTLLWGGIYNPIIPVSKSNKDFSNQLLNLFSVDVLFAVSNTEEINQIIKTNPFLKDPSHYAENIFYEDWHTKKNIIAYLDSINIFEYYWEKEFKNKPVPFKSNCALVKWENADFCSNLFSITFGQFPTHYNLKDDFQSAFLRGLKSEEIIIPNEAAIQSDLIKTITPIKATSLGLSGYGGTWRGDGLYIGSESDFTDLLYFWNLRAAGLRLDFLSKGQLNRFDGAIKTIIKQLDGVPNKNPNIEDWITIYSQGDHEEIKEITKSLQGKKRFMYSHCDELIWNGLNIKPSDFYFKWQQVLANVEKKYEGYTITSSLPEKSFLNSERSRNTDSQSLAVSISPNGEFSYPFHTLRPPFIQDLNEFYSREISFDPWRVRSEKDGIAAIQKVYDQSLMLSPLSHQKIIEKIFEHAGYKASISQPGLLAKQIIEGMREDNPLEACRIFKITGVRKLIASPLTAKKKRIKRSDATRIIWESNFSKFESLYIESRDSKKLSTSNVFNFLIKKRIFAPKLRLIHKLLRTKSTFKCRNCGLKEKINVLVYEADWICPNCFHKHFMPNYILEDFQNNSNKYWRFERSGLFSKENNQEGAIPVIISLLTFARILDTNKFLYSTSLKLKSSKPCEIDFCILQYGRGENIQIGIAECKSEGQQITQQNINNMKAVQDEMKKIKIDCFLIFSKTVDNYNSSELQLFNSLKEENRKFIILSNKELEPYHPYWELNETENLPEKYALDMSGMCRNSQYIYLK